MKDPKTLVKGGWGARKCSGEDWQEGLQYVVENDRVAVKLEWECPIKEYTWHSSGFPKEIAEGIAKLLNDYAKNEIEEVFDLNKDSIWSNID